MGYPRYKNDYQTYFSERAESEVFIGKWIGKLLLFSGILGIVLFFILLEWPSFRVACMLGVCVCIIFYCFRMIKEKRKAVEKEIDQIRNEQAQKIKGEAMEAFGLSEDEIKGTDPIVLPQYSAVNVNVPNITPFNKTIQVNGKWGTDGVYRSPAYLVNVLLFSKEKIYLFQSGFSFFTGVKFQRYSEEIFYEEVESMSVIEEKGSFELKTIDNKSLVVGYQDAYFDIDSVNSWITAIMKLVEDKRTEYSKQIQSIKSEAINKFGIDEDEVKEADPIILSGIYSSSDDAIQYIYPLDIQVLLFSREQMFYFKRAFLPKNKQTQDFTQEYFYIDIVSVTTSFSDGVGQLTFQTSDTSSSLTISYRELDADAIDRSVNAVRSLLRDKKKSMS